MDDKNKIVEVGKNPRISEIQGQYIGLIKIRADKVKVYQCSSTDEPHCLIRWSGLQQHVYDELYSASDKL